MLKPLKQKIAKFFWDKNILSTKSSLYIYRHLPSPPSVEFKSNFYGFTFRGNLKNYIDRHVYFYGAFEKEYLDILSKMFEKFKPRTILDIGCNIGHHTMFFAGQAESVHAFDPYDHVLKIAKDHIAFNQITNVIFHNTGLSNIDSKLPFYLPPDNELGVGSFEPDSIQTPTKQVVLNLKNGDNYINELKISNIDFVKIDVEGHEKSTLKGIKKTLLTHQPIVMVEVSLHKQNSFKTLEEFMSFFPSNYSFYFFERKKFRLSLKKTAKLSRLTNNHFISKSYSQLNILALKQEAFI